MSKHGIAVVGASGYSGEELVRLLLKHPHCEIRIITSRQYAGKAISSVLPRFSSMSEIVFSEPDAAKIAKECQFAFLALPHGLASEFARPLLESGVKVLDLSADFRIKNPDVYKAYYKEDHPAPELLSESVYGLPELYRAKIAKARLVACPGCYPTSVILPLHPLLREGLIKHDSINVSSMSGVSGAGRKIDLPYIFPECNESLRAYSPLRHRHLPEIEQELALSAGAPEIKITFIPHLVPVNRGIVSTITAEASAVFSKESLSNAAKIYKNEFFARVLPEGRLPDSKYVESSNFCDISYLYDERTGRVIAISAIDNLTKGAAGQAVQCLNIMLGVDEKTGLV
jgi:N-acetyl-gamma-glutamyl-phosphate reductase